VTDQAPHYGLPGEDRASYLSRQEKLVNLGAVGSPTLPGSERERQQGLETNRRVQETLARDAERQAAAQGRAGTPRARPRLEGGRRCVAPRRRLLERAGARGGELPTLPPPPLPRRRPLNLRVRHLLDELTRVKVGAVATDALPKALRDRLGIRPGSKVEFALQSDDSVRLRVLSRGSTGLFGLLAVPGEAARPLEDIDLGVTAAVQPLTCPRTGPRSRRAAQTPSRTPCRP
jgi:bifunctional DNA-binding transcriptional regulator/antitoxin component of YhaV-PrlF toxin-antitoxin module